MEIVAQAPTRLSLFGGGTDLEPYASKYGGVCISLAINLRQHFIFGNGNDNVYPVGADPYFYKKFFDEFNWHPKAVLSTFDSVVESGIGASASAAVALVASASKAKNLNLIREQIAEKAWDIEVNKIGLYGGKQDQYAAAFGGLNLFIFKDKVERYPLETEMLEKILPNILLFYIGSNRKSSNIQEGFKKLTKEQINSLDNIREYAYKAVEPIQKGEVGLIGELLEATWKFKKLSNKGVSNKRIDRIYDTAMGLGAIGGKIMGAGGGGHMIFIAPLDTHKMITTKLSSLGCTQVDFSPDFNGVETRIIK